MRYRIIENKLGRCFKETGSAVDDLGNRIFMRGYLDYVYLTKKGKEDVPFWLGKLKDSNQTLVIEGRRHYCESEKSAVASFLGIAVMSLRPRRLFINFEKKKRQYRFSWRTLQKFMKYYGKEKGLYTKAYIPLIKADNIVPLLGDDI